MFLTRIIYNVTKVMLFCEQLKFGYKIFKNIEYISGDKTIRATTKCHNP